MNVVSGVCWLVMFFLVKLLCACLVSNGCVCCQSISFRLHSTLYVNVVVVFEIAD